MALDALIQSANHWYLANAGPVLYSPLAEHTARLSYAMILILIFGLIDYTDVCKAYKINPKNRPTGQQILTYTLETAKNMFLFHIVPLVAYEMVYPPEPAVATYTEPTLIGFLVAPLVYLLFFDVMGYIGHYVSHRPKLGRVAKYLTAEHHEHHVTTITNVHAWNGYFASPVEALGGLVFFQAGMLPMKWLGVNDPLTRAWSIFVFQSLANASHSGYDFPFEPQNILPWGHLLWHGSVGHYYHHKLRTKNISIFFAFWDIIFDTHFDHLSNPTPHEKIYAKNRHNGGVAHGTAAFACSKATKSRVSELQCSKQ